jgi:hypothetical protein
MAMSFDGTSIQASDYTIWFDVRRGGPGETAVVAGIDTVIPGQPGFIPMPREKRGRVIELYGWLKASSLSAFITAEKALLALFDPTNGASTLSMTLEDSTTATILAQPQNVVPEDESYRGAVRRYSIELVSGDPDWTIT